MPTLTNNTTLNADITLSKQEGTVLTLKTKEKYVDKDIEITMNAAQDTVEVLGGVLEDMSASILANNATLSTTNTSGIVITPIANATRSAITTSKKTNGWVNLNKDSNLIDYDTYNWNGDSVYLKEVTLPLNSTFTVIAPDGMDSLVGSAIVGTSKIGDSMSTYTFSVDSYGVTTLLVNNNLSQV